MVYNKLLSCCGTLLLLGLPNLMLVNSQLDGILPSLVNPKSKRVGSSGGDSPPIADPRSAEGRRRAVRQEFLYAWRSYTKNSLGKDEINPLTGESKDNIWGGWGVTLIDSLDTLWLMDLKDEFYDALKVVERIDFTRGSRTTSFFEVTIRNLGGLIAAYDLSHEPILKRKAQQLGDLLLKDFQSPSKYPYTEFDFVNRVPVRDSMASLANIGSCQLEFTRLSFITGDPKYRKAALEVYDRLDKVKPGRGQYYSMLNVNSGEFINQSLTFGAYGDSFFEYLIKLYVMAGPHNINEQSREGTGKYLRMFDDSIDLMRAKLVKPCNSGRQTCLGSTDDGGRFVAGTQHLNFFVPGMLLLADQHLPQKGMRKLALDLLETFSSIPQLTKTGLAPEYFQFSTNGPMRVVGNNNALRPELIESLFYAYRATKDPKYQDRTWRLFSAFVQYSKARFGFAEYSDVMNTNKATQQTDSMPSYFLAETFKYMYLVFCKDDVLPLDDWVLNTEAHPFKISK